tara:strand:- start:1635 stop:2117 length:483 start_codon:yes stop_codon:yes gene_type:complete
MHNFLKSQTPLVPGDAVAIIINSEDGKYLLQHRDDNPQIFFPNHWSLFGGGIDPGETSLEAIVRETHEELGILLSESRLKYCTQLWFDFSFEDAPKPIRRIFYHTAFSKNELAQLKLGEGQGMALVTIHDALSSLRIVPYDAMALWMHHAKDRIKKSNEQ